MKSAINELTQVGEKAQHALAFAKSKCEVINDVNYFGDTISEKLLSMLCEWYSYFTNSFGDAHIMIQ